MDTLIAGTIFVLVILTYFWFTNSKPKKEHIKLPQNTNPPSTTGGGSSDQTQVSVDG